MKQNIIRLVVISTFALVLSSHLAEGQTITQFRAIISEAAVITEGVQGTGATATGIGDFVLTQPDGNPDGNTMSYHIQLNGVDLDGFQTATPLDNVTAVHLHNVTECMPMFPQCQPGDTALTMHVLNIYGFPREDDADLVVDAAAGTLTGLWDVSDTNMAPPAATMSIADHMVLDLLFDGKIFFMLHTNEFPSAAIGGQLVMVPEPTSSAALALCLLGGLGYLRRWRV